MGMRKIWIAAMGGLLLLAFASQADAVIIGFEPAAQNATPGSTVDVGVAVSDLGDFAPDSLGTFDLDVGFDPTVLAFNSFAFGDPVLGDQLDLFGLGAIAGATPGAGTVNLFELSLDLAIDLDTLQAGAFTLGVLTFDALASGTSPLSIGINALGDSFGDPLTATVSNGSVVVATPLPEPASLGVLGLGLVALTAAARRRR